MDPIQSGSKPAERSALQIFTLPSTDISVESSFFNTYVPTVSIKENLSPILFHIPASSTNYMSLSESFLYVKARIVCKPDGSAMKDADLVVPCSNFFYNMFSQVQVSLNGKLLSDSQNMYPYTACIRDILTRNYGEKTSVMQASLYYPDSKMDQMDTSNSGFASRLELCKNSKIFDFFGRLAVPIFECPFYLPTGCELDIRIVRSLPQFCLDSAIVKSDVPGVPYDFVIENCTLYVKWHTIENSILLRHNQMFSKGHKAKYALRDFETKSSQISSGSLSYTCDNYFSKLPPYLILGLVSTESFQGSLKKSPMNFQNYGLSSITVRCENDLVLTRTLEMDYDNGNYMLCYQSMLEALGQRIGGNDISRKEVLNGKNLFAFSLVPTTAANGLGRERKGKTEVNLIFKSALPESVNVIMMGCFTSILEIDGDTPKHAEIII